MIDFTPIMRRRARARLLAQQRYITHAASVQQEQLVKLIERASLTWQGRRYEFSALRTYDDFASAVPLSRYEDLREAIMRMVHGEADVLWPGRVRHFAQSSGTSDGKSKYIPITTESFRSNHYQGASDVVSHYLNLNPKSRLFAGKGFILGGSFANEVKDLPRGVRVGDLSANLIEHINPIVNLFRVPDKRTALMPDWTEKLPALVERSRHERNITNLSGVPSWFLTVITEVLRAEGKECIHDVWPKLEVFFHGGINFEPYRARYEQLCDMNRMHFLNTYNASEGFFATQSSWESTAMLLLLDVGVFYEFIPIDEIESDEPHALPIWEIENGKTYELVITAVNGLWRYRIGDTVKVEQVNPVKISIAGRTKSFINAFGEELMVHNADEAITAASQQTGAQVLNYTAAPVYASDGKRGCHQWLIEFAVKPSDMAAFTRILDDTLKHVNSDYEAKRTGDIFLDPPQVVTARHGIFEQWLAATGKLGGQRKVPRLCNDRKLMETLLNYINDGHL